MNKVEVVQSKTEQCFPLVYESRALVLSHGSFSFQTGLRSRCIQKVVKKNKITLVLRELRKSFKPLIWVKKHQHANQTF